MKAVQPPAEARKGGHRYDPPVSRHPAQDETRTGVRVHHHPAGDQVTERVAVLDLAQHRQRVLHARPDQARARDADLGPEPAASARPFLATLDRICQALDARLEVRLLPTG